MHNILNKCTHGEKKLHDFDDIKWIVGISSRQVEIGLSGNPRMNESNFWYLITKRCLF